MADIILTELRTEIQTDPNGYGYAALMSIGDLAGTAALINKPRATIPIPRPDVTPLEILEAINVTDFVSNANSLYATWFGALMDYPQIRILKPNGTDTRVMSNILKLLANGSQSETRIRNLASRPGSRAEQLWGEGAVVTVQDLSLV